MKEIKLTKTNHVQVLQQALSVLQAGGTIVYPTETSYGLGGDFYNEKSIDKIYTIKQKKRNIPLPVIVADVLFAATLVNFTPEAKRLSVIYWPGPLTLILSLRPNKLSNYPFQTLGLRISSHPFVQNLVRILSAPLISTSANISGQDNCYTPQQIKNHFNQSSIQPDLFINAGILPIRQSSTVISFTEAGMKIMRQGEIKI